MKKYIYIIAAGLALYSCGEKKVAINTDAMETQSVQGIQVSSEQFEQSNMTLGTVTKSVFPETIHITGMIDVPPQNKAVVSAVMGGYVKETHLLVGDQVKKGQTLMTLENPEFVTLQQNYLEVKQQLNYLKTEYERQQTLMQENITSQKSFLKAESDFKTAQARYLGLKKQLQMLNISTASVESGNITSVIRLYAPINGSVTQVNVNKGMYVSPATSVIEIVDNEHIHLELTVFEKDVLKIKKGQKITFVVPEVSDKMYEATVHLVGTSLSENRTVTVHGHLNEEGTQELLLGMFVEADLWVGQSKEEVYTLPSSGVLESGDNHYVLVLKEENTEGYVFQQVAVKVVGTRPGFTGFTIEEPLAQNARLLLTGGFNVVLDDF